MIFWLSATKLVLIPAYYWLVITGSQQTASSHQTPSPPSPCMTGSLLSLI